MSNETTTQSSADLAASTAEDQTATPGATGCARQRYDKLEVLARLQFVCDRAMARKGKDDALEVVVVLSSELEHDWVVVKRTRRLFIIVNERLIDPDYQPQAGSAVLQRLDPPHSANAPDSGLGSDQRGAEPDSAPKTTSASTRTLNATETILDALNDPGNTTIIDELDIDWDESERLDRKYSPDHRSNFIALHDGRAFEYCRGENKWVAT